MTIGIAIEEVGCRVGSIYGDKDKVTDIGID
jgi:hypothetical protein